MSPEVFHLRPAKIIIKTKSVGLSAGYENSCGPCGLLRAFMNKADSVPFMLTVIFSSLPPLRKTVMLSGLQDSDTLYLLDVLCSRELHHSEVLTSGTNKNPACNSLWDIRVTPGHEESCMKNHAWHRTWLYLCHCFKRSDCLWRRLGPPAPGAGTGLGPAARGPAGTGPRPWRV